MDTRVRSVKKFSDNFCKTQLSYRTKPNKGSMASIDTLSEECKAASKLFFVPLRKKDEAESETG